jgi:hypothetical protein
MEKKITDTYFYNKYEVSYKRTANTNNKKNDFFHITLYYIIKQCNALENKNKINIYH